jgi:hypothetical protein
VLEAPAPLEDIKAAARIVLLPHSERAVIDIFAVASDCAIDKFLKRLESVVRSFGFLSLVLEIPQWREDMQEWAALYGFEDKGGHEWPAESLHMLTKHTMILEYQVRLSNRVQKRSANSRTHRKC